MKVVAVLDVNKDMMAEASPGTSFESEMGWVATSGITLDDFVEIPEEAGEENPIETVWVMREVDDQIRFLKESKLVDEVSTEDRMRIVNEIQNNYETIEQDIEGRICDLLGIEQ